MKASETRRLERAGIEITALGLGSAPFGGMFRPIAAETATATIEAAWDAGIRFFDTAPMYGMTRCEHLVGQSLRERDRATFRLSTKVGRIMANARPGRPLPPPLPPNPFDSGWANGLPFREVFDYSYDAVMRSYDDSQQRTGLDRFDILLVHDIGRVTHGERQDKHWQDLTSGGGFRALRELKDAGLIAGFGLGVNEWQVIRDAMEETDLDVCLLAGRYTLLDQDASATFLPLAAKRQVDIVVGGVFNSGILVRGPADRPKFDYADAPPEIVAKATRLQEVCVRFGVPLAAAALQFPQRNPAVASVVIGAAGPDEVRQNVAWYEQAIPDELWTALCDEGLIAA
jgi:D-threo-aldose 1-dehydrogenase